MNRRDVLIGGGSMAFMPALSTTVAASANGDALSRLQRAAHDAYIYTLPLIESATARAGLLRAGGKLGNFLHARAPTTPATQRITTPNNDTLNSRAWLDLGLGPVRLSWPATGQRYISVAMMDMFSNNFAVLGSRNTGPDGGSVLIVGPDAAAPPGAVRAPTRWMWLLIRILTTGGDDLPAAIRLQDACTLEAPAAYEALPAFANRSAAWDAFFTSAGRLLAENPGPAADEALRRRIAPLSLERFDPQRFSDTQAREIASGVARARQTLAAQSITGPQIAGWSYPRPNLGNFGQDYLYRAQTAMNGFAALPPEEALYAIATGTDSSMKLDSARAWRLHLRGDALPPNDGFWSLTMYRATPEGQFFLFDNPISRYSIGDRTNGLRRGADGSVDIRMQRTRPPGDLNWLPTPGDGPFGLVFRVYRPREPVLDGRWRLPPIERAA